MVNRDKMEDWFYFGIFLIAMLFAFIAVVNLYSSIDRLIDIWFDYRYRPRFQTLFSLSPFFDKNQAKKVPQPSSVDPAHF